jgi:hypothetical protein
MGTQLSNAAEDADDLQGLPDPEFFARWAAVRARLALTPKTSAEHEDIRQDYDAVTAEYRRRMVGGAE